jgi:hypothetical protein
MWANLISYVPVLICSDTILLSSQNMRYDQQSDQLVACSNLVLEYFSMIQMRLQPPDRHACFHKQVL